MKFLVTGAAGFLGSAISKQLLALGHEVIGVDGLEAFSNAPLKRARLERLDKAPGFQFHKADISVPSALQPFAECGVDRVIHMAAQAGVRHSIDDPMAFAHSNLSGHLAVLEFCRRAAGGPMLIYASSSSVYGVDAPIPMTESNDLRTPASLYAATKRADELMSESYASLYGIKQIGLRFFTVYGPWGRPDMVYWLFTERILDGRPIQVFNHGDVRRDFTFVDDAAEAATQIATSPEPPGFSREFCSHLVYNVGSGRASPIDDLIEAIEGASGQTAIRRRVGMQPGDVVETCADSSALQRDYGWSATVRLADGVSRFVDWYKSHVFQKAA